VVGTRGFGGQRGRRRIDDPADPVRIEVETALRSGMSVVPVLVEGARMPRVDQLPDSLKDLIYRNGQEVGSGRDFDQHIERLIRNIDPILAQAEGRQAEAARLAEEERQQAEAARRAEEERQQAEATRRAEEERQHAEAARRAEEERQHAEAARRAEEERQQTEAAQRVEEERQQVEAALRVEDERQQAEEARRKSEEEDGVGEVRPEAFTENEDSEAARGPNGTRIRAEGGTMDMTRRASAEFFGTFWLTFGGCGSAVLAAGFPNLGIGFLGVALAFGLTVLTMAYAVGHVSGGHFNPAVTMGLWAGGRFKAQDVLPYILAQVIGGIVAAMMLWLVASGEPGWIAGRFAANGYGDLSPGKYSLGSCLIAELLAAFFFLFVIIGSTSKGAAVGIAGIPIGLCLTLIHLSLTSRNQTGDFEHAPPSAVRAIFG
jgi:aquaporin Z